MTKWWNDPEQRSRFKKNYSKNGDVPDFIPTFANTGDYLNVQWTIVPQLTDPKDKRRGRGNRDDKAFFEDMFAFIMESKPLNRDPRGEPTIFQLIANEERKKSDELSRSDEKLCQNCGDVKHVSEFDEKSDAGDKRQSWCQKCKRAYAARWQHEKRMVERLKLIEEGKYRSPGRPTKAA